MPAASDRPARVLICRSNPIAPDPRVEKEARSLSQQGYSVTALGWDRSGLLPQREDLGWACVVRLPIRAGYARGLMNFLPLILWQVSLLAWLVSHRREFDILHACDFDTILPALACKKAFKKVVVYDIFDFYADHLRLTPQPIKRLIRRVDLWAIGQADAVILVDESRQAQIAGSQPKRLAIMYNTPEDVTSEQLTQPNPEDTIHLAYVGLMQVERGLLDLLEVVGCHPDWKLDLAGFGGDEALLLERAKGLKNVAWHGRVLYSTALALSAQANVLVALYDPSIPNHRYASPNKIFEAMMLARPVIVARDTNVDRIIQQTGSGLVVEYGNAAELEAALERLERDPDLRARLGCAGRKAYEETYSWNIMERRLIEIYHDVENNL